MLEVPLGFFQRFSGELAGRRQCGQLRIGGDQFGGEADQQLVRKGRPAIKDKAEPVIGQDTDGQAPVTGGLGVPDRFRGEAVRGQPVRGGGVQHRKLIRLGRLQLQLQQVGEQPVVAEPGPGRVQRDHERARLLQLLQNPSSAGATAQQVGELAVDPLENRCTQQQPANLPRLALQHLGQQILGHRPLTAREPGHKPFWVRVPRQRQRRQPQPGRPALGALMQSRERRRGQFHPGRFQQRLCFLEREAEISGPDLG